MKQKFLLTKSPDYLKTHQRRNELLGKRLKDAEQFLDIDPDVHPSFRRTTRSYHVTKDYAKHLHSPSPGSYSPKFDTVESDPTMVAMIGNKQ